MANDARAKRAFHHGNLTAVIVRLGLEALEAGGTDAVGLRGLAKSAGVYPAAVSHHFRDREGILAALAADGLSRLASSLRAAADTEYEPTTRLLALLQGYIDFARGQPKLFQLMFSPSALPRRPHPQRDFAGRAAMAVLKETTSAWALDAAPNEEVETLARYLWSVAHGAAVLTIDETHAGASDSISSDAVFRLALRSFPSSKQSAREAETL